VYESILVEMFMKMKTQPLNDDVVFMLTSILNHLIFDVRGRVK